MADEEPKPDEAKKEERRASVVAQEGRRKSGLSVTGMTRRRSSIGQNATSRMQMRRPSYGFTGVPGVRPIERTSQMGLEFKRPVMVYLPTYQLDALKPFHLANTLKVVEETLDDMWDGHKYNPTESPALAMKLAGEIMRKVKNMGFDRYRVISIVTIAQKRKQSYTNTVSFIWDYERDGYVDTHREEHSCFVQVTVFGIYLD